jgi:broad specificity phosphatase PhoE
MRIFVIRHGETEFNRDGFIQGNIDSKLTELGVRQSLLLADELRDVDMDMIFSSTAQRAYLTARPIAAPRSLPIVMAPDFRERDYGIYEEKSLAETKKAHPGLFATDSIGLDFKLKPKDGESLNEVADRVLPFLKKLTDHLQKKTVVIVAHGIVNKIILGQLLDNSLSKISGYKQSNACINEIILENGAAKAVRLNYIVHLKQP